MSHQISATFDPDSRLYPPRCAGTDLAVSAFDLQPFSCLSAHIYVWIFFLLSIFLSVYMLPPSSFVSAHFNRLLFPLSSSRRTGTAWCSSSSSWGGPCTATPPSPSALSSNLSTRWTNGRRSTTVGRGVLWSTACEYYTLLHTQLYTQYCTYSSTS